MIQSTPSSSPNLSRGSSDYQGVPSNLTGAKFISLLTSIIGKVSQPMIESSHIGASLAAMKPKNFAEVQTDKDHEVTHLENNKPAASSSLANKDSVDIIDQIDAEGSEKELHTFLLSSSQTQQVFAGVTDQWSPLRWGPLVDVMMACSADIKASIPLHNLLSKVKLASEGKAEPINAEEALKVLKDARDEFKSAQFSPERSQTSSLATLKIEVFISRLESQIRLHEAGIDRNIELLLYSL